MTRAPFALLVAAFLAAIAPSPAVAHAQLDRAAPPVGATVKSPPQEISLIFSERVVPGLSSIRLSGLAGPLDTGPIVGDSADRRRLILHLPHLLAPGRYRVRWTAVSVDGHRTEGDFTFSVDR